jgi:hypothetical protein
MPTQHQVTCISRSNRNNVYDSIDYIGGKNDDGSSWKLSEDEATLGIENGKWSFYVFEGGRKVNVIIATSAHGKKYLKTEADNTTTNNLLSLPECK